MSETNPLKINSQDEFLAEVTKSVNEKINNFSSDSLKEMTFNHFQGIGKMIRPKLVYGLAKTLGVDSEKVLGWAVSCELLHNASLIHDDLQDGDKTRRGRPTTWYKYGKNHAINIGDFLLIVAPLGIIDSNLSCDLKLRLNKNYSEMASNIVIGQSEEFVLNQLNDLPNLRRDYFKCVSLKTAALFSYLAKGVAISGEISKLDFLGEVFNEIGIIFQIQDDILDLFGDKKRESVGCDIQEGKVSFLIVKHFEIKPSDMDWMIPILKKERSKTNIEDIEKFRIAFLSSNTLNECIQEIFAKIKILMAKDLGPIQSLVKQMIDEILNPIYHLMKEKHEETHLSISNSV
jgi:geranylgeranyl diphosphate synthase, type I